MNINLTLIAQAVAFALFIWFTAKFVWPPLLRAIEARQKHIADGLAAAEQRQAGRSSRLPRKQAEHADQRGAQQRAARSSRRPRSAPRRWSRRRKDAAKEEGDREKAAAKAEIEQESRARASSCATQVAALAVAGAEKILRREVDAKAHAELLDRAQAQL